MAADPAETPKIITVAEGFHVRQEIDNITWMDMGDWGLAVDALERPELEEEVFEAIGSTLGDKPVRYLLNTHTHYDHMALNAAFGRRWGTQIVNQRTTPLPPEGRWFEGEQRRVQMLPAGGCHTREDCVVWSPADKALLVGDIFGWGLIPLEAPLNAKTVTLLEDTYARLIAFGATTVIPGHGPLCTTAELVRWVEYFRWLRRGTRRLCAEGADDGQIARDLAPPEDMKTWWRFGAWKHEDSLAKVLAAARRGRLEA